MKLSTEVQIKGQLPGFRGLQGDTFPRNGDTMRLKLKVFLFPEPFPCERGE